MVKVATRNGQSLGLDIDGRVADAEGIPYDDDTFDLVVGHAVLHHIPDVELSLREVMRVLKPGGRFVFAGEPTTVGNEYARTLSTLTWRIATNVTKLPGLGGWRRPQEELDESSRAAALEAIVDLHTFAPEDLERMAKNAGAIRVETASEEFSAAMFGWPVRTFESSVPPGRLGWNWARFAFNGWKALGWMDANVWRHVAPKGWFYNVMVTGLSPPEPCGHRRRFRRRRRRLPALRRRYRRPSRGRRSGTAGRDPNRRHHRGARPLRRAHPHADRDDPATTPGRGKTGWAVPEYAGVGLAVHRHRLAAGHGGGGGPAPGQAIGRSDGARRDLLHRH
ncbi:methyltransferase domain protein [Mycobacterium ulcerans str. Harvey]|uniref:Methyltransferase domain protein n=1 Tax=Mycobacterium ulcerans str. Harvey TaxID=1299332 RepID=A0ABP3AGZ0_MYCUL|nr:methyltransferase domain protein [Mycobacterium ulcerans str. Harvey]